mmetsp:Transcript_24309/g.34816  ORF Transcript_24309/g.34816 Transcript_24309/m.34816 type:complete len:358 (+) Transcript_24309:65-1138(+)
MADDSTPILALPGGSVWQFFVFTIPLFGVYCYFLYLAITRPDIADPDNEKFYQPRIRLTDILYVYLTTWVLYAILMTYMTYFVSKRRRLSKRYEKEGITVLGDVLYDDENRYGHCGWLCNLLCKKNDYGYVVYDLERVAKHPACDFQGGNLMGKIKKKVRIYYRYPREQVSILVLPQYPFSGQPKIDLEADWASFSETYLVSEGYNEAAENNRASTERVMTRDRSLGITLISLGWLMFLLSASVFVCLQIGEISDVYEDESSYWAWTIFAIVMGGVTPVVAIGGNLIRWKMYERWILKSGKAGKPDGSYGSLPRKARRNYLSADESVASHSVASHSVASQSQVTTSEEEDGAYIQMA